jgi:hypothetical protein
LGVNKYFFVDILLKETIFANEIGFVVLLLDFDELGRVKGLEGDCFRLEVGGNIGEIELAPILVEGDSSDIFYHCELIIIDGDCQGNRAADD